MGKKNTTLAITLGGIVAALEIVIMLLASLIPTATYALPALAGIFAIVLVIELNVAWGFGVYVVTALISALLLPDKMAALIYILFFGYYPIVKALIERLPNVFLAYAVKFATFNAAAFVGYFFALGVMGIPPDTFLIFGAHLPWLLLLIGNGIFFLYDWAVSGLILAYVKRLHPLFEKWMHRQ